ncbi:hypothetical protein H6F50_25470 [Coleofasciculus sp. FACHB-712]|uniref:hypothetical protein n=1 Tax=Coleofasciculus sp. FACHB-712 TaxID=2692789 RepID=UPI001683A2DD|nr:hypothetical protein [Coleofasciculus sp. FACHB-712]MBD1945662.1 hypothetical protein [Coleofasciculus sp. FACHB-712]
MFRPVLAEQRHSLLEAAGGKVLEIGFGTGKIFPIIIALTSPIYLFSTKDLIYVLIHGDEYCLKHLVKT